jgi:hypothetical protein
MMHLNLESRILLRRNPKLSFRFCSNIGDGDRFPFNQKIQPTKKPKLPSFMRRLASCRQALRLKNNSSIDGKILESRCYSKIRNLSNYIAILSSRRGVERSLGLLPFPK